MTLISAKKNLKKVLKGARVRYVRAFRSFSNDDLERLLRALGLGSGDTVLVHSAFDAFEGFTGKPTDVLRLLQAIVTEKGALILPTLPFSGTAVAYAASNPVFDPARTPSRMGLLTELFRRSAGVVRSIHPTHSVAVWGGDAQAIVDGHWLSRTPCGAGSPYARLLDRNGKILMLGADISSLTFYHYLEEALAGLLPFSPFTQETYRLRSRLGDGSIVETETRLFEPSVSKRRNLEKLIPALGRRGAWRQGRVGGLEAILLDAAQVELAVRDMLTRGEICYD
jgi:aminoglycoside 3-N-acetyltransferase